VLARLILFIVLAIVVARAFWRLVDGVIDGISGRPRSNTPVPSRGVAMVRDPVCGTFVLPDRARMISDGRTQVFFCSDACRDQYRARTA
jgi:YHS domain-containing protein